ncbi:MAG: PVC-type heme-binding CxxCH protein [Planctomycetota bacterium]|nr:PVC-type heme-binding CxxCH protein [Planctomycetota bacterium]
MLKHRPGIMQLGMLFAVFVGLLVRCTVAAEPAADSVDRDYSNELQRIPPTEPSEALKTFKLVAGFRVELVAAEPLVVDPVAMAFDEYGRLFVVEMRGYSEDEKLNIGRVRLLTDTDNDGRYDKSSVYVDGLSWPTAVSCWDGGVFVGAAPDIRYCKDTDGDGKADINRVVFTGFGRGNVQGLLNTFKWGPDNRIHGATSSAGASVRRPDKPELPPVGLRGRDFAFNPRTLDLEPTSGGGQHGLSFTSRGDKFVCSNSNHIQFVAFEDRYARRNPYVKPPSVRWSIASDGPQATVFRSSPVEPWRIVRTRLRVKGIVPGPVEGGGTAAGYFTGSTGITIYRGDSRFTNFSDWAFVADVGSNLIHRKRLERKGIGFIAHRMDEKSEFLTSTDIWFRPVQMCNGPDGGLYIADMYREVIEHPGSLPPPIKKHLDLNSGRNRGRIYRIVDEKYRHIDRPELGNASLAELVDTLSDKNGWHRDTAARLIYGRGQRRAIPILLGVIKRKMWPSAYDALWGLGGLAPALLFSPLDDSDWQHREHAVRLAGHIAERSSALKDKLCSMANDPSLRVRYQLAFTLGEVGGEGRNKALASIVRRDAEDPYIRFAVQSSLSSGAGGVLVELAADEKFCRSSGGQLFLRSLVAQIARQRRPDDVAALLTTVKQLADKNTSLLQALLAAAAVKKGSGLERQIQTATAGRSTEAMKQLLTSAAEAAGDFKRPVVDRVKAIHLLRLGVFDEQREILGSLLDAAQPSEVQLSALSALATFEQPEVADLILKRWRQFSPQVRTRAHDVLFSRDVWLANLLEAAAAEKISVRNLDSARLKLIAKRDDSELHAQATLLIKRTAVGPREAVLKSYAEVVKQKGDIERGRGVFKKVCAACHRLEGVGHEIAPNLATMRNRTPENILLNVLDPGREVNPQFMLYEVVTREGRSLTGMIVDETATSVTLKRANNESDTILRIDIDEIRSSGLSLMPEGLEKEIDRQAMADLLAYLQSLR